MYGWSLNKVEWTIAANSFWLRPGIIWWNVWIFNLQTSSLKHQGSLSIPWLWRDGMFPNNGPLVLAFCERQPGDLSWIPGDVGGGGPWRSMGGTLPEVPFPVAQLFGAMLNALKIWPELHSRAIRCDEFLRKISFGSWCIMYQRNTRYRRVVGWEVHVFHWMVWNKDIFVCLFLSWSVCRFGSATIGAATSHWLVGETRVLSPEEDSTSCGWLWVCKRASVGLLRPKKSPATIHTWNMYT